MVTITLTDEQAILLDYIMQDLWPYLPQGAGVPEPGSEEQLARELRGWLGYRTWQHAQERERGLGLREEDD